MPEDWLKLLHLETLDDRGDDADETDLCDDCAHELGDWMKEPARLARYRESQKT